MFRTIPEITPATLTVTGITADKVYDGTATATLNVGGASLIGIIAPDVVSLNAAGATATFADKNIGVGKTVTVSGLTLAGADAGDYTLTQPTIFADITPAVLTVSATGVNKVYDGTMIATVTLSDNRIAGDIFIDSYASANFADKNIGLAKPVSITGISIAGIDAGNYTFNNTAATVADITALPITVTAVTDTKVYDTTTNSSAIPTILPVLVGTDTPSFIETFNTPIVGVGKILTPSGTVNDGNGGNNYSITFVQDNTGVITQATR